MGRALSSVRIAAGVFVAVAVAAHPAAVSAAEEDAAARCVDDASVAQKLRDNGHLTEARALFVSCAADSCPGLVRKDCIQWLTQVDERLPTVVIAARDKNGKDLPGAKVTLDGKPVNLGRSIQLDPGPHTLAASHPGLPSRSESVVVAERDKGRSVVLVLETSAAAGGAVGADARPRRSIPVLTWVLGGVALLGGVGFGVFWYQGMDEVSSLRSSCAPGCTPDQIDDARTPLNIARVSAGVGIAAAVSAVAVYLLSSDSSREPGRGRAARTRPASLTLSF